MPGAESWCWCRLGLKKMDCGTALPRARLSCSCHPSSSPGRGRLRAGKSSLTSLSSLQKGQKCRAGDAALHRSDRGAPPEQREVNLSSRVKHFNYNSYNMYK